MVYEEYETVNGRKLAFTRCGEWSSTVILFFHGFWGASFYLPEDAGKDICVISFDRPGIGRSDLIGRYRMEDLFLLINTILDDHGVKKVRVFGHSAGGYYAQVYAMLNRDRAISLTLLSSLPPMNCRRFDHLLSGSMKRRRFLTLYLKPITMLYFIITAKTSREKSEEIARSHIKNMSPEEQAFMEKNFGMYTNVIRSSGANNGKGAYYDACSMYDKREVRLDLPVFIWCGEKDVPTTPDIAKFLSEEFKARNLHVIEGGTHHMYLVRWHDAVKETLSLS